MKRERSRRRNKVTPYVGVWIEITGIAFSWTTKAVTPYVGVWIEIIH